jgi:hypothetical protein
VRPWPEAEVREPVHISRHPSAQRRIGDVLIAWENEAFLLVNELGKDKFEIVAPSVSILAEPPVALVDKNASKHGTTVGNRDHPRPRLSVEHALAAPLVRAFVGRLISAPT